MRSCPTCQRVFPDDNQTNCQFDGAPLSPPFQQPGQYQPQQQYAPQYAPPPGQPGMSPMPPPPPGYGAPPPAGWQQGYPPPPPGYQAGAGQYVPCPRCQRPDPEKVGFTWWGGLIGPRMLSHVKCRWCGLQFNGKSGKSNTTGIVIYSVVLFVIALAIGIAVMVGAR